MTTPSDINPLPSSPDQQHQDLSRRDTRMLVFHILYALDAFDYDRSVEAIVDTFNRGFQLTIGSTDDVIAMAEAIAQEREALDHLIKPLLLNWRFERIGLCTKLILRMAVWELKQKETPSTVIINEAIEISKCFAEKDAYKFVNGILDEAIKTIPELKQDQHDEGQS